MPFADWLDSLGVKEQAAVAARLARVEAGNFGDCKPVKSSRGIRELRIPKGPGYRIYFAEDGKFIVLLLTGGDKKTQKKDIQKAKEFWREYQE